MIGTENKENPLIAVIMPAYNAEAYIEEAITSVMNQSVTDWELIVIDDCSQDQTQSIVKAISERDSRVKLLINEKNSGAAVSRNKGLEIFCGEYVALLDSDDYWYPQMLEKMLDRIKATSADIVYCSYEIVDENKNKICNDFLVPEKTTFKESIVRSVITCSTVMVTGQFAKSHRFPTNMYHEDIALWFEALRNGATACGVTDILAAYRQSANTKSANKLKSACRRWKIYRNHLKMPLLKSMDAMLRYAFYGVLKYKRV